MRWDVCCFPRRVGRCRRCGPGSSISFRLDTHVRCWAVSESPRIAMRRRPRFHGRRSQLGGAGQHWRRGLPRSQSGWQHVSLSPACDDGAPGVARSCPRSGWHGAKRRSTQRTTTTIRVSVSDAPRCALPSGPSRRCSQRDPLARVCMFLTAVRDASSSVARRPFTALRCLPAHRGGARRARAFPLRASCRSGARQGRPHPCALHVCA